LYKIVYNFFLSTIKKQSPFWAYPTLFMSAGQGPWKSGKKTAE